MADNQGEKIQARFKLFRKTLRMNQKEFADKAKIMQSQVSEIENGKRNITSSIIISLEDTFQLNRKWLMSGEGDMFLEREWQMGDPVSYTIEDSKQPYQQPDLKDRLINCYEKNILSQDKNIKLLEEVSKLKDQIIEAEREIRHLMLEEKKGHNVNTGDA